MRMVFLGTDEFGEMALRRVAESSHDVVQVVTQPDRPKGRGRKVKPGVVRMAAGELGIPCIQPATVRDDDARNAIAEASADILTVVSYGEYIPRSIFEAPRYRAINVHPSLLPRWRGAAPVRYALLAGDEVTGVTVQYIHKRMDAGDILLQEEVRIEPDDDHGSLCDRLYPLGAELLVRALDGLEAGTIEAAPQDESLVTKAPKIEKDDLRIDWSGKAVEALNRIRAFSPDPGARAGFRDGIYKILKAEVVPCDAGQTSDPGLIRGADWPRVDCGDASLLIKLLQPPGKKPMSGRDWANGYRIADGERFVGLSQGGDS